MSATRIASALLIGQILLLPTWTTWAAESPPRLPGYVRFDEFEARLRQLDASPYAELSSLGKTAQGRDIWLLTISHDLQRVKPGILVLGNVHAPHLVGRELALRMAERWVASAGTEDVLGQFVSSHTIYVIACPSPDATEKNWLSPAREIAGNSSTTDEDRDFQSGEDPPIDRNGDGWITLMRVADTLGSHRLHPDDPRVMIPVENRKGETGAYRIYTESQDADDDTRFGEDASDGVDFNRNFTFNYPYFGCGAGPYQVSEAETRAVADFAFDHPNIGVVFCFSPEDNLFHPWKPDPQRENEKIKTTLLSADAPYTELLAETFRRLHGGNGAPPSPSGEGSFSAWAYFHFGRWSFASRAWWIPPAKDAGKAPSDGESADARPQQSAPEADQAPPPDTAAATDTQTADSIPASAAPIPADTASPQQAALPPLDKDDKRGAEDLAALAWFAAEGIDAFVDWQPIEHPDFPNEQVEIGGFKPFYRLNPPARQIDALVQPHLDFLVRVAEIWPRLELREVIAKRLAPGLYEVECRVVNTGYLPTMPQMGSVTGQWYPIQLTLGVPDTTRFLEGQRRTSVVRLEGRGGELEQRWIFQLAAPPAEPLRISLQATAPTLHEVGVEVELRP